MDSARAFVRSFLQSPQTFNAFYADDQTSPWSPRAGCRCARATSTPDLPTRGDGEHEWRGLLSDAGHPQQINPRSGTLINWNNKTARGFEAADDAWNYGTIHRVELLTTELAKRRRHDLASVTAAMNAAATQDLLGEADAAPWPVLRGGPAPSPRAARMLELLEGWTRAGSSRLDRDLDGRIDSPGRRSWTPPGRAWPRRRSPRARPGPGQLTELGMRYDLPPRGQSGGWHLLPGPRPAPPAGRPRPDRSPTADCGGGDLAACRTALWEALDAAGVALEAAQGVDPRPGGPTRCASASRSCRACCPTRRATRNRPAGSSRSSRSTGTGRALTPATRRRGRPARRPPNSPPAGGTVRRRGRR